MRLLCLLCLSLSTTQNPTTPKYIADISPDLFTVYRHTQICILFGTQREVQVSITKPRYQICMCDCLRDTNTTLTTHRQLSPQNIQTERYIAFFNKGLFHSSSLKYEHTQMRNMRQWCRQYDTAKFTYYISSQQHAAHFLQLHV